MADRLFEEPRLANIYDALDSVDRPDLEPYLNMMEEFGVHSVIDLGCGTGTFAGRLVALGKKVIGVEPAAAMLNVARRKSFADQIEWIHGTSASLAGLQADIITMTANVAQVFVTDEEWMSTLRECRAALRPGGRLAFEVRDPSKEEWKRWNRETTYQVIETPEIGSLEKWVELLYVHLPLVTFRPIYIFHKDGAVLDSDSTLRFRSKTEIIHSLSAANLAAEDIRTDPSGLELIFIARRLDSYG